MTNDNILNAVIESTGDVVYVKDLEGVYLLVNAACARLMGMPAEEILGHDVPIRCKCISIINREIIAYLYTSTYIDTKNLYLFYTLSWRFMPCL